MNQLDLKGRVAVITGAARGIYALWVNGQAGQPYLTAKQLPVSLNVGGVSRDFSFTADASGKVATNPNLAMTPTAVLAPFQYTMLLWATIMGWVVWRDIPSLSILVGSAIIIGSGLFVLYRDR